MAHKVVVVADTPSPHQNCYFDAIARRGEVDLRVLFCRHLVPEREVWEGVRPTLADHRMLSELPVAGMPTNPTLVPTLLAEPDRLPFMVGYYLPGMLMGCLALGALRRPWVFWTDTLPEPKTPALTGGDGIAPAERIGANPVAPAAATHRSGPARSHLGDFARRFCLEHATSCLTTGEAGRRALHRHGVPPERVFDIPFVVDSDWIMDSVDRARADRESLRRSLGVARGSRMVLFIGQMIRRKGLDLLLDAAADLCAEGAAPSLHFVLVGEGPDLAAFREQSERLGLSGIVSLVPAVKNTELPAYWAAADALVLPSYFDAWPVVVVEALIAGLPVLGSDACGSVRDRVTGETGWIFPAGKRAALAACLRQIACLPREKLAAMGAAARVSMQRFSPGAMASAFTQVVEETLWGVEERSSVSRGRLRMPTLSNSLRPSLHCGGKMVELIGDTGTMPN